MPTEITIGAANATSVEIAVSNIPAGGAAEIFVADNPQFRGLVTFNPDYPANDSIRGLNQRGTYYAKARGRTAGGVRQAFGATVGFTTTAGNDWDTEAKPIMVSPALLMVPDPILGIREANASVIQGYPLDNMLDDDPGTAGYAVPVLSGGDYYVVIDFETAGSPADFIALLDTDLPESAVISLAGTTSAARRNAGDHDIISGAWGRASANLPQRQGYHAMYRFNAPVSCRFWRLYIRTVAANLFRQGRLMMRYIAIGRARYAKNISTDKIEQPLDLGAMDRNRAGGPDRTWGHKMRKVDFEISVMTEMQWETQFSDLWRKIGLSEPVLVVPNSKSGAFLHDRILFGTVASARSTQVNSPIHSQAFSIESLI